MMEKISLCFFLMKKYSQVKNLTLPFNNIKIIIHEKSSIVYLFSN